MGKNIKFTNFSKMHISVGRNEKKTIVITESGEYIIDLNGEGAVVTIVGMFIGKSNEDIVVRTFQHHKASHTTSNLLIKSVLMDNAVFQYDGLITIEKNAQQSNAYQKNENLLLSTHTHVQSKPKLEILANDVRCTHAVTMGTIDDEQLFYLISRGLSKKEARQIIIEGFLQSTIDLVHQKNLRNLLMEKFEL